MLENINLNLLHVLGLANKVKRNIIIYKHRKTFINGWKHENMQNKKKKNKKTIFK